MSKQTERVLRHSLTVRITHWLVALSGLALLFSGFGELPMYKRYKLVELPGLHWAGDFELQLVIHYVASIVFIAAAVFHVAVHLRRRETEALPRRGDLRQSAQIIKAMVVGAEEAPHGKFLAEQRVAYAAIAGVSLLLIVTGLVKVYKNLGDIVLPPLFLQTMTLLHTVAAMVFLVLVIMHLGAFVLKANWPLLPSMFTGYVSLAYAMHRHPRWRIPASEHGDSPADDGARRRARKLSRPEVTVKDVMRFVPGLFILTSVGLAVLHNVWWLSLAVFVGVNLVQSALTRWCLLESVLCKLGVPGCDGAPRT